MMSIVRITEDKIEGRIEEVDQWLNENAGVGSIRFGGREGSIDHWLNGDDWLYYRDEFYVTEQSGFSSPSLEDINVTYVFRFKDDRIATEFALRFC